MSYFAMLSEVGSDFLILCTRSRNKMANMANGCIDYGRLKKKYNEQRGSVSNGFGNSASSQTGDIRSSTANKNRYGIRFCSYKSLLKVKLCFIRKSSNQ